MPVPIVGQAIKVTTPGTPPLVRHVYVYESDPARAMEIAQKFCPGDTLSDPLPLPEAACVALGLQPGRHTFWP